MFNLHLEPEPRTRCALAPTSHRVRALPISVNLPAKEGKPLKSRSTTSTLRALPGTHRPDGRPPAQPLGLSPMHSSSRILFSWKIKVTCPPQSSTFPEKNNPFPVLNQEGRGRWSKGWRGRGSGGVMDGRADGVLHAHNRITEDVWQKYLIPQRKGPLNLTGECIRLLPFVCQRCYLWTSLGSDMIPNFTT